MELAGSLMEESPKLPRPAIWEALRAALTRAIGHMPGICHCPDDMNMVRR